MNEGALCPWATTPFWGGGGGGQSNQENCRPLDAQSSEGFG